MSISKLRGKSALGRNENLKKATATTGSTPPATNVTTATADTLQHKQQIVKSSYLPLPMTTTSLLKIDPFVPSFSTRLRKPIHRSYSTLSSTYFKRVLGGRGIAIDQQAKLLSSPVESTLPPQLNCRPLPKRHNNSFKLVTRQRSRSHCSSASKFATTILGETAVTADITQQPNGVCKITRNLKEQEKLPDRINYDRRGLTAIPIFENEPNLRLLSLQHNLINTFHIPQEHWPQNRDDISTSNFSSATMTNGNTITKVANSSLKRAKQNAPTTLTPSSAGSICSTSTAQPTPPQSSLGTKMLPVSASASTANNNINTSKLFVRNSFSQKTSFLSTNHNAQEQHQRYCSMKRSKSFVSNYSKHLKRNLQICSSKQDGTTTAGVFVDDGMSHLSSFDCGSNISIVTTSTSENLGGDEEQLLLSQLNVKNNQLHMSYGMIFQNLVFLDLYDNQIERISNLDGLPALSVLLLGKNRIFDISGLSSLKATLRVLDLHGNKITSISNKINCLQELKSLNLAGNQIRQINPNDFSGMLLLKELNLKRNKIKRVNGFQHLTALERLWLCNNDLHKVDDMSSIAKAIGLLEVTIENNPVSLAGDCVSFLVSYLPRLQTLSQMPITEQVRRAAMAWRKNKELSEANYSHLSSSSDVFNSFRREEVISNARTNWELLRSQQTLSNGRNQRAVTSSELSKIPDSAIITDDLGEFNKLPPIEPPPQQQQNLSTKIGSTHRKDSSVFSNIGPRIATDLEVLQQQQQQNTPQSNLSASSVSSLGPNVDSSSSCFSSDNEDDGNEPATYSSRRARPSVLEKRAKAEQPKHKQNVTSKLFDAEKVLAGTINAHHRNNKDAEKVVAEQSPAPATVKESQSDNNVNSCPVLEDHNANQDSLKDGDDDNITIAGSNAAIVKQQEKSSGLRTPQQHQPHQNRANPTSTSTTSSSTMNLGINGNSSTAAQLPNENVNAKRYLQGSLMRSQTTTKPNNSIRSSTSSSLKQQHHHHHHNNMNNNNNSSATNGTNCNASGICVVSAATTTFSCSSSSSTTIMSTVATATNKTSSSTKQTMVEREREQGGDYLIEICGRYLNIYGMGALRFIDKQWNQAKANDVHTLNFSYINFNNITAVLSRIKVRFPHAENFVFRETNITCLGQLNALADLQGIVSLCIDPEGNAITTKDGDDLWRMYAIYRLSHWGLKLLNGSEVTKTEIEAAHSLYAGLSDLVLWSMPEVMLQPLLSRLRLDETCTASKLTAKDWLMKADHSLRIVVGKEALQWKKPPAGHSQQQLHSHSNPEDAPALACSSSTIRERGKLHCSMMIENACNAVEKLHKLETLWPSMLLDIVRNTLLDYSQMDPYLRNLMSDINK